ncbi:MAG: dihydrolipoyl dehydrogenase [Sandaracinus sp.]
MADRSYDVIVIGSGPGGYVAAIRAAQLGLSTVCVEKESLGGVCLNWGCIPSKALIQAAGFYEKARTQAGAMGVKLDGVAVDVAKMQEWKAGIVRRLTTNVGVLIRGAKGETLMGTARVLTPRTVEVVAADGTKTVLEAKKGIVVATGATPISIPSLPVDGEVVLTAKEAVSLTSAPGTMVLVGGGVIGMELGMVYQKLGTKVIVVEMTGQLLGTTDVDLVKVVERKFLEAGGEIHYGAKAQGVVIENGRARLTIERDGETRELVADKVVVAIGFRPNGRGLGLEEIGVALDARGHVLVDDRFETNVKGVYAIGDVSGAPYLAHKATKEAEICAEVLAGHEAARDWRAMPAAIFTEPEIATVGLSERECAAKGRKVKIGKFPFSASGRAMAVLSTQGFVKSIVDAETHEVLGVGIVGPEASDLISEAALAIEMLAYAEDVHLTVHPHPTLGEAVMESFKHALKEAIHIPNR